MNELNSSEMIFLRAFRNAVDRSKLPDDQKQSGQAAIKKAMNGDGFADMTAFFRQFPSRIGPYDIYRSRAKRPVLSR